MASNAYPITSPTEIIGTGGTPGIIYLSDGTNSVELRAPTGLVGNVDFTLPSTVGTIGQSLQRSGTSSTTWVDVNQANPNSTLPASYRFNDSNGSPASVSSTVFTTLASFVYLGTNTDSTMINILAIVGANGNNALGEVQLFDFTNSTIIATSATFGPNIPKAIINLGTISNLPTGQAILEIQLRRVNATGGGSAEINSFQITG